MVGVSTGVSRATASSTRHGIMLVWHTQPFDDAVPQARHAGIAWRSERTRPTVTVAADGDGGRVILDPPWTLMP